MRALSQDFDYPAFLWGLSQSGSWHPLYREHADGSAPRLESGYGVIPGGSTPLLSARKGQMTRQMTWFTLFGRKHCKVCSTATIIKRDGKYVCISVNHAANVTKAASRQAAAQATAGHPRTGRKPKLCPACNTPMNRFMTPVGERYKCMNPNHARRTAAKKSRRNAKRRRTWKKKK
jgi:hypothetical protein